MSAVQPLFLLDTNVVSNLRKHRPSPAVLDWIRLAPPRSLAIAWSTVFEIQYGAELARAQHPDHAFGLETWLERFVLGGHFRIVRPNAASVRLRARMHATPSLRGFIDSRPGAKRPANGEDLTIAATAIVAHAVVVTLDDKDFTRIHRLFPLPGVLNPMTGSWSVQAAQGTGERCGARSYAEPHGTSARAGGHDRAHEQREQDKYRSSFCLRMKTGEPERQMTPQFK